MGPAVLDPFFAPASTLPGVGPKNAKLFDRLLARDGRGALTLDVLFHLPYASLDRRSRPKIRDAARDQIGQLTRAAESAARDVTVHETALRAYEPKTMRRGLLPLRRRGSACVRCLPLARWHPRYSTRRS